MKAALYDSYGPAAVLQIGDVARPEIGDGEVLVQVHATTVTTADWRLRASAFPGIMWLPGRLMFGLFAPRNRVLGHEFSGRVVSRGKDVTRFRLGDAVFGFSNGGAHAQYLAIGEDAAIAKMPAGTGYDEAAAVPFGAVAALVFLRDVAKLKPDQKVLVLGASGGVGVYAVQIAKHIGAEATGVASTANVDLVASLGADRVIDYRKQEITDNAEKYDLVFDTAGIATFATAKRALAPQGVYIPLEFGAREIWQALVTSMSGGRRVVIGVNGDTREDMEYVAELLEKGAIRPVIDSRYPLERIADAHRRVETRHKTGSVVVTVAADGDARPAV
jgi:NADPH:quinone reductase-like Zn-dependent oxidoreductase